MSFPNDVYVCGKCGYHAKNNAGSFENNEEPFDESIICFGCQTDTPPVIREKDFLNAICQHSGCTETRENHNPNKRFSEGKLELAHEFVSP